MQLQLCWDERDQNNLLFKFKIDKIEETETIQEEVEKVQIKFELLKKNDRSLQIIQEPFLISIKDLYFSANILAFSVKLDKLNDLENLQIRVIRLTIFYYSGRREDIFINKTFQLTEITYDDGQFIEIMEEEVIYEKKTTYSYKKRSVTNKGAYSSKNKKTSTSNSLNPHSFESPVRSKGGEIRIPVSKHEFEKWLELKGDKPWDTTLFMVRKTFNKYQELEKDLKEANIALRKIAINKSSAPSAPVYLQAPSNYSSTSSQLPTIPQSGPTSSVNNKCSLDNPNAQKVLGEKKNSSLLNKQKEVMREMKEKFERISDVKQLLSKVPKEELNKKRAKTDHLAFLEFKQKRMEKERAKKIKLLKGLGFKDKVEELALEDLEAKIQVLLAKEQENKN
jgi:hypothetical protein